MINLIFIFALLLANSCFAQEKTGFAVDIEANNVAALFTMTNESGRVRNLDLMESVFKDGSLGFDAQRHHNVSSPYIYEKLKEMAENLDSNATLLLYFNSHGGGSGNGFAMTAQGGSFKFSKALESLKKSNKKIRRLILLVDTCHAQGSIQDSINQNGDLLRDIQVAKPTKYLPELPEKFSSNELPFMSIFIDENKVSYGQDSGVYEEILIISACSVEDLATRGIFADRLARTFEIVKKNKEITVKEFLKKFADSHYKSGQQPYFKALPDNSILEEFLFGPFAAQKIPIVNNQGDIQKFNLDYIPIPKMSY